MFRPVEEHRSAPRVDACLRRARCGGRDLWTDLLSEEVTWEARHFGVTWRMTSRIVEFDPPRRFVDEMVRGPFTAFRHEHLFEAHGSGTRMTDVITFRTPFRLLVERPIGAYLRRLMTTRNATIRRKAESARS